MIMNNDNECFRWCHIRYLNPQEKDPQRSKKKNGPGIKLPRSEIPCRY